MKHLITLIVLSFASSQLLAQTPTVNVTAMTDTLYLMQGRGGNVLASVGGDGVLLIDNDYGDLAQAYSDAVDSFAKGSPRFVVNTHWHGDHTGSNAFWGGRGVTLVAHDNVRKRLSNDHDSPFFGRTIPASEPAAWPVLTYADSMAIHFNYDTLELRHLPGGHTDGDTVVFFVGSNVVHMGDLFFKDRFPFIDASSGGSALAYLKNVEAVLQRTDSQTIIVPGHGSLADKADLARYLDMLETTRREVIAMKAEGLALAAMQKRGLDPRWKSWGGGFINEANYISFVAADL